MCPLNLIRSHSEIAFPLLAENSRAVAARAATTVARRKKSNCSGSARARRGGGCGGAGDFVKVSGMGFEARVFRAGLLIACAITLACVPLRAQRKSRAKSQGQKAEAASQSKPGTEPAGEL